MSTKILRYCDHCKQEIPEKDKGQIWKVQLLVINEEQYIGRNQYNLNMWAKEDSHRQDWCRPCVDKFNMLHHVFVPPKDEPNAIPPSFEDQLREIIRDEIQAAGER